MDRRQKDIITMAAQADLIAMRAEKKNGRQYITCAAENGVERKFSISLSGRSDPRGDLNELGEMKRFSRENRLVDTDPRMPTAPKFPPQSTEPKPLTRTMNATPKKNATMTLTAKTNSAAQLAPVDFYRVCEWLKSQTMANIPSIEALAMLAAQHLGSEVTEADMATAMQATGIKEPMHWAEPTDPHAILVRELSTVMKELGVAESPAFANLRDKLLPA